MTLQSDEVIRQIQVREQLLARVQALLVERLHLHRDADEIDPDCPLFGTGLGLDSVDAVELVVGVETAFGLRLSDEKLIRGSLRTVNSLVDLILTHGGPR